MNTMHVRSDEGPKAFELWDLFHVDIQVGVLRTFEEYFEEKDVRSFTNVNRCP